NFWERRRHRLPEIQERLFSKASRRGSLRSLAKPMDPREELKDLIAQAKEHLRYFGELGLTHIGESSTPPAPLGSPTAHVEINPAEQIASAKVELEHQEPLARPTIPPPEFIPKPTITMAVKKQDTTEPTLFGEQAPPAIGAQPVHETLEDIRRDLGDCRRCK